MLAFLPLVKIDVATSVCTGCSNMPPAYCIRNYSNPSSCIKSTPSEWMGDNCNWRRRDFFAFLPLAKIDVATSVCTGCSNMPPAYCICNYSNPSSCIKSTPSIRMGCFLWRRRRDLNPRYPFGVYTISNRARSASYATSPSALYESACL